MNVKIRLTILFMQLFAFDVYSQDWNTSLNSIPPGGPHMLGSTNCAPVDIYTRNQLRFTIDTNGVLRSTHLAGTGSSFLRVTADGAFVRAEEPTGDTWECNGQIPWVRGGNTVGGVYSGNFIGTCDNYDFVLKAYNKRALFIKASNSYIGVGHNNSNPSAQLDIFDPSNSNTSHFKIHGDADGTLEAGSNMNLVYNGLFTARSGNYGSSITRLQVDNSGNTGIGGARSTSWKMLIHATSIDGFRTQANLSSSKALQVYATNTSKEAFTVFGDGKTVIGDETGASNLAKLSVNVNNTEAINVFDASSTTTNKEVFRVSTLGRTSIGNQNGATNAAMLNVNVGSGDAINVFNPNSSSSNKAVFKVDDLGKTIMGMQNNTPNAAHLNINVNSGEAINVYNSSGSATDKVSFRVYSNGKTCLGDDASPTNPNPALLNLNILGGTTPVNVLNVFDGFTNANNFRIKSNGELYARYFRVTVNSFPDYVFEKDYQLMQLSEIEQYYLQHKRLPEMPSADEVQKNDLELGALNVLLVKKIEELTIHLVELGKEIENLKRNK